jgi:hypothetical protein
MALTSLDQRTNRHHHVACIRAWRGVFAALTIACHAPSHAATLAQAEPVRIELAENRVDLRAEHASWRQLLDAIGTATGMRFHYPVLPEGDISLSVAGLSAPELLAKLFESASGFVCIYPKAGAGIDQAWPSDVWIVGALADGKHNLGRHGEEEPGADSPPDPEAETRKLLEQTRSADLSERNGALTSLSLLEGERIHDPAVQSALLAALAEGDEGVRGQIVYGLGSRAGPEAVAILRTGLRDGAASVRQIAAQTAEPSDTEGLALLREALHDSDENVRATAEEKLKGREGR